MLLRGVLAEVALSAVFRSIVPEPPSCLWVPLCYPWHMCSRLLALPLPLLLIACQGKAKTQTNVAAPVASTLVEQEPPQQSDAKVPQLPTVAAQRFVLMDSQASREAIWRVAGVEIRLRAAYVPGSKDAALRDAKVYATIDGAETELHLCDIVAVKEAPRIEVLLEEGTSNNLHVQCIQPKERNGAGETTGASYRFSPEEQRAQLVGHYSAAGVVGAEAMGEFDVGD